jgi:tRNA(Ile)-lysidine synthase
MRVAERADGPLGDAELDLLFAPFVRARLIALAVSGGADSLALMVAAERWRRRRTGRPDLLVLTVDHRLRRGSGAEARMVAAAAAAIISR